MDNVEEIYNNQVTDTVVSRIKIIIPIASSLFIVFSPIDFLIYPEYGVFFLKIRILTSVALFSLYIPVMSPKWKKYAVWVAILGVCLVIASMAVMIYLTNGSKSIYYDGYNLTLLALLVLNGFYLLPNLIACVVGLHLYWIPCILKQSEFDLDNFISGNFLLGTTIIFILVMTKFYSIQHYKAYKRSVAVKQSQKDVAETNIKLSRSNKDLENLYQQATEMARRDMLTGLFNQMNFKETLKREFAYSKRYKSPLSIMFIDLDYFKEINDMYGHQAGDKVLKGFANILLTESRSTDTPARYGGDELAVVLPSTNKNQALFIAERLCKSINKLNFQSEGGPERVGASIGVAELGVEDKNSRDFLDRVDRAVYIAKESGRGRVAQDGDEKMIKYNMHVTGESGLPEVLTTLNNLIKIKDKTRNWETIDLTEIIDEMGRKLKFSDKQIADIKIVAILHDAGNIGVPDVILLKTTKLNDSEWDVLKNHAKIGRDLVIKASKGMNSVAEAIYYHHERWDGTGYPEGLKGEDIPVTARIVSVLDAYSAMISKRPYRNPFTKEHALLQIKDCSGSQFDPKIVEVFVESINKFDGHGKNL
ncbi:MAG: diguanylate cyclase [bacterium]